MYDFGAIDKCLQAMRNRIGFKTYNPNKPAKYGINIKCLNEVRMAYTHRSEVFAGKPEIQGQTPYYNPSTEAVTLRLFDTYGWDKLKGRNISLDNLYTSIPMTQKMLEKGVTVLGTMRHNRKGLPKEISSTKDREHLSSKIWYEKEKGKLSLVSYVVNTKSKGKKNVVLLSSHAVIAGVTKDDDKEKPALIKVYDYTKGGTDICDQRAANYSVNIKSPRWTIKLFCYMLDTSRINVQTLHSVKQGYDPRKVDSFDFGWNLVSALTLPQLQRRKTAGLQKAVTSKIFICLNSFGATDF